MKRALFSLLLSLTILALAYTPPASAEEYYDFTWLSSSLTASYMSSMAYVNATDNIVYICTGYGVGSYDVTDPATPVQLDLVATDGMAYSADVATIGGNNYLVVADREDIEIIDITNPSLMVKVSTFGRVNNCRSLDVKDTLVFAVFEANGQIALPMKIYNIADPANPTFVANTEVPMQPNVYYSVAVDDTLAFVAAGAGGLLIFNVANPYSPFQANQATAVAGSATSLVINPSTDHVAVAVNGFGVPIYDYSNPYAVPLPNSIAMTVNGFHAFHLTSTPDLIVATEYNVAAPAASAIERHTWTAGTIGQQFTPANTALGSKLKGDHLYIFEGVMGYQALNLSPPGPLGSYREYGGPRAALRVGDYAYIADYSSGVAVMDLTDLTDPDTVAIIPTNPIGTSLCYDVAHYGNYVYGMDYNGNLEIIEATATPASVNSFALADSARAEDLFENYLYVATNTQGVQILDLTNPTIPVVAGTILIPAYLKGVTVADSILYVCGTDSGVYAYKLDDPENPTFLDRYDDPWIKARMVSVDENLVYVAGETELVILDNANLATTGFDSIYSMEFTSDVRGVTANPYNHTFYVAEWEFGVDAYRLVQEADTTYTLDYHYFYTPGQAYEVVMWDSTHLLICDSYSLEIWEQEYTVGVKPFGPQSSQPAMFSLDGNYPNPFNPSTTIAFSLKVNGKVTVSIYDLMGRLVATAFDGELSAGEHRLQYHGDNLASGTYIVQVSSPWGEASSKMVLLK